MSDQKAVHVIVRGDVQGVGFRHFTRMNATQFGVAGWVRNNYDGTVEIWAEGPESKLNLFIQAVRRGPSYSRVDKLDITWKTSKGEARSFNIRY